MTDVDAMLDFFLENIKKLFFPEQWINLDLKFSKFEIFTLLFVDKRTETTMSELVEYINSPMSTATGIVDRLVNQGYIKRARSETDRRIVLLSLTEEGLQFIKSLKDMITEYVNIIVDGLTEEEKQFMIGIAFKILHNFETKVKTKINDAQNQEDIKNIAIE